MKQAILYHLVDLYQVCSKYSPVAKIGSMQGVTYIAKVHKVKHENEKKIVLSGTTRHRALVFVYNIT